mmetsp:Transcript_101910/g.287589  ORF Transcript_101910/g.287589 Transcript_101910/m.287589 type:complete len:246 (+) Transcript_101910:245-982(+)
MSLRTASCSFMDNWCRAARHLSSRWSPDMATGSTAFPPATADSTTGCRGVAMGGGTTARGGGGTCTGVTVPAPLGVEGVSRGFIIDQMKALILRQVEIGTREKIDAISWGGMLSSAAKASASKTALKYSNLASSGRSLMSLTIDHATAEGFLGFCFATRPIMISWSSWLKSDNALSALASKAQRSSIARACNACESSFCHAPAAWPSIAVAAGLRLRSCLMICCTIGNCGAGTTTGRCTAWGGGA